MKVILFDETCGLCNRGVHFVYRRDPRGRFRFAPGAPPDTLVLLDGGRRFERSGAALRIARGLRWPWPLVAALLVVPRPLRDAAYDLVARRRHRLGLSCPAAPAGLEARMLQPEAAAAAARALR